MFPMSARHPLPNEKEPAEPPAEEPNRLATIAEGCVPTELPLMSHEEVLDNVARLSISLGQGPGLWDPDCATADATLDASLANTSGTDHPGTPPPTDPRNGPAVLYSDEESGSRLASGASSPRAGDAGKYSGPEAIPPPPLEEFLDCHEEEEGKTGGQGEEEEYYFSPGSDGATVPRPLPPAADSSDPDHEAWVQADMELPSPGPSQPSALEAALPSPYEAPTAALLSPDPAQLPLPTTVLAAGAPPALVPLAPKPSQKPARSRLFSVFQRYKKGASGSPEEPVPKPRQLSLLSTGVRSPDKRLAAPKSQPEDGRPPATERPSQPSGAGKSSVGKGSSFFQLSRKGSPSASKLPLRPKPSRIPAPPSAATN